MFYLSGCLVAGITSSTATTDSPNYSTQTSKGMFNNIIQWS